MKALSKLEKRALAELYKILATVKNSDTDNSDSIQDFIHNQFEIKTDEETTLNAARIHFEIENKAMLEAFDIILLLIEHFDV